MMILTNLNRWVIILYVRSWKEEKGVPHARRAVSCVTRTCHTYFCMKKSRVRVHEEITASLLLYRVNILPFLRIESTQLKQCIKYRRY
jgi:hypothetical protein